jgi:hypothetical protein
MAASWAITAPLMLLDDRDTSNAAFICPGFSPG